jgi:hypothetical protein
MLAQLGQVPAEALPQMLAQLETAVPMAPDEQKPLLYFAIGKLKEMIGK